MGEELSDARSVDWPCFDPAQLEAATVVVVRCTFLLEARSSSYGAYLRSVLPERMHGEIDRWEADEQHHGRALRRWLGLADPTFSCEAALNRFGLLPYHEDATADRGGPARE